LNQISHIIKSLTGFR